MQDVVRRLAQPIKQQYLGKEGEVIRIQSIPRSNTSPLLRLYTAAGAHHDVDQIIFATQANQARKLLLTMVDSMHTLAQQAEEADRCRALSAFEYTSTLVVNHFDESTLPSHKEDRRDLNISHSPQTSRSRNFTVDLKATKVHKDRLSDAHVQATHILPNNLLQTTNPITSIPSNQIISSTWLERALLTPESKKVLDRYFRLDVARGGGGSMQGVNGVWFVGSWAATGLPLLEGCVDSAERVVAAILLGRTPHLKQRRVDERGYRQG